MCLGNVQSPWFAHGKNKAGVSEPLRDHLRAVSRRAAEFAAVFGAEEEARLAGLLHDLGKYGDYFQARLRDPARFHGVDHWSAGASEALVRARAVAAALAIQGHHLGLMGDTPQALRGLDPGRLAVQHPQALHLSCEDVVGAGA